MATIKILAPRAQEAHFGLYKTSCGGDEPIYVRRKIADPTDYMHTKSRKLQRQQQSFALATKHYAQLTPSQKNITRHQMEDVEYQQSHGKTDTKLLTGRQLFISKEIRSLNVMQKQLLLPYELCIMLVDAGFNPLSGELWLRYLKGGEWHDADKEELTPGHWLFNNVPRGQEDYRVYGESDGFMDLSGPLGAQLTEEALQTYHYHVLFIDEDLRRYYFVCGRWWLHHWPIAYRDATAIYVQHKLYTHDYTGEYITGLIDYWPYHIPEVFLAKTTHFINATDPDPKYFYDTWTGLTITRGTELYLYHALPGWENDTWVGHIAFCLLSDPPP